MMTIEWKDIDPREIYSYDADERLAMEPQDGVTGVFVYWWEGIRPFEIAELIKEAYEAGRTSVIKELENQQ